MKPLLSLLPLILASCTSQSINHCVDVPSCGARIHQKISSHLVVNESDIDKQVMLRFTLGDETEIKVIEVIDSSGDERFDNAVVNAVKKSFPDNQLLKLSPVDYEKIRKVKLTVSPR
ncbi:cell envelope integrity protein TolA [Photobacterium kasasachensis]|uniref:cell envelope integrity protein TolA n=1 Tax=Photobacterium kasasachensis TaxID=2910240 RepID=UPI003D09685A